MASDHATSGTVAAAVTERVRRLCIAMPDATERPSHGSPAFFARKQFVMLWATGHHDHDFPHLWCAAAVGVQSELVAEDRGRFFVPPYVGDRGWVGVRLDGGVDWTEIAQLCQDAYRCVAPAIRIARLDEGQTK